MEAGLIGYRNHSARILNLLLGCPEIDHIYVYHPDGHKLLKSGVQSLSSKVEPTSDRSKLSGLDAVFITSPSRTHVEYIRSLIDEVAYLYCEKPPAATREELAYLSSLAERQRHGVYFSFNYRFSELAIIAKDFIESGQIGSPVHYNFVSTHGLAYRESFRGDWRSNREDQLSGNLRQCVYPLHRPLYVAVGWLHVRDGAEGRLVREFQDCRFSAYRDALSAWLHCQHFRVICRAIHKPGSADIYRRLP